MATKDRSAAERFALDHADQLQHVHSGPHAPGTHVRDTDNNGDEAVIIGMGSTWATVVYWDEPDVPCSCGNAPGRWILIGEHVVPLHNASHR